MYDYLLKTKTSTRKISYFISLMLFLDTKSSIIGNKTLLEIHVFIIVLTLCTSYSDIHTLINDIFLLKKYSRFSIKSDKISPFYGIL